MLKKRKKKNMIKEKYNKNTLKKHKKQSKHIKRSFLFLLKYYHIYAFSFL